ncbi:YibE/F family protein [Patescibacteria group bacterium]|nr:YibE/F family protein [Patescibacteria group bacterium]
MKRYVLGILALLWVLPGVGLAQEVHQEWQETVRGEVLEVTAQYERDIMGTDATTTVQELRVQIMDGERSGEVVRLENDLVVLDKGDAIFVDRLISIDDTEYYLFKDVERRPQLIYLTGFFVLMVLLFAGWQGARALISLSISVGAILLLLVPALLAGYSPALTSLGIAALILAVTLFITHGINARSVIAFIGTLSAVAVTCAIAAWSVSAMRLTGFASDASVFLNFSTGGTLDFTGLLLGSIIIGLLGVLDDVSITQASVVQELRGANQELPWLQLYTRAIRVGRDHVGSLVNTLALAYVGAALPLVLLFARADSALGLTLNQEVVAVEIVRIVVGSIGLILAVPLTTVMAAWYFKDKDVERGSGHSHGHAHHHH